MEIAPVSHNVERLIELLFPHFHIIESPAIMSIREKISSPIDSCIGVFALHGVPEELILSKGKLTRGTSALRSNLGACVANRASIPAKDVVGTTAALDQFMHRILAVPHSKIKAALEAEKAEKRTSVKRSASRVPAASKD